MLDERKWRVQQAADYICDRQFSVVTLQFPDEQLQYAARVATAIQANCASRGHAVQAYILADTTYNSLSVDEVAAAHVDAQCVVHYGRASMTKLSRLPAFFVFPEQQLNVPAAAACLAGCALLSGSGCSSSSSGGSPVLVFLDQPLLHCLQQLREALLGLVEEQQGAAAAARLVFPAVPRQQMEPEQPRGQPPPGCCGSGGGGCGTERAQQADEQQKQQQQQQPGCRAPGAAPQCSATAVGGHPAVNSSLPAAPTGSSSGSGFGGGGSDGHHTLAGYHWHLPAGVGPHNCGLAWVGAPDAPALLQLQLTYSACQWAVLDPSLLPPTTPGHSSTSGGGGGGSSSPDSRLPGTASSSSSSLGGALTEGLPLEISRVLQRRYYLVERARDASIVGILLGTLGAAGYADAADRLRAAAAAAGKKTYTLLMGKPSPAKLANFPEIEVFVLVADPQGQILDSKEYLAPIITPHEAWLAFAPPGEGQAGEWDDSKYRLDFEGVLEQGTGASAAGAAAAAGAGGGRQAEPRFSLLTGGYAGGGGGGGCSSCDDDEEEKDAEGADREAAAVGDAEGGAALVLHAQQALQVSAAPQGRSDLVQARSAADYLLHKRTWQGVEAPLVGAAEKAVVAAAEGRTGRAAGYADEPRQPPAAAAAAAQQQQ